MTIKKPKRLGDLLIAGGKLTEQQLRQALKDQKLSGKKLGEILVDNRYVTQTDILEVLEVQLDIPSINLNNYVIETSVPNMISETLARRHELIPIDREEEHLIVAMTDPLDILAMDDIEIATGMRVKPVLAIKEDIKMAIDRYYRQTAASRAVDDFEKLFEPKVDASLEAEKNDGVNDAPAVKLVNTIIKEALKAKASDIHIEPFAKSIRVRFRIDGELQEIMSPAKSAYSAIVTRIKIMGQMDIAEKRVPQDGRIEIIIDGKEVDLRISTLPTVHGEKVVIRLLDRSSFSLSKEELGLTKKNLETFDKMLNNTYGMILVTGPTGSGKTTTLYSALKELNTVNKNIITVENPVEYRLEGVNQVQVNNKAGMTFAASLRSILRQDPDVIMIGEIRDAETAEIAIRSSITGHLVLSTMHTNDAPSTVTRLIDMGIKPYLISSSVVGVIAQRLVRRLCDKCKESYMANAEERMILGVNEPTVLYKAKGCNTCYNTGYKGRIGVHEVMPITKELRSKIDNNVPVDGIRHQAIEEGMLTLRSSCKQLVLAGTTTLDELRRVTFSIN